jgi:hypothetical protein
MVNLAILPVGSKAPYTRCPSCGVALTFIWWQRLIIAATGLMLSFAIPGSLGVRGLSLLLAAAVCIVPSVIPAFFLVFTTIQPRYVRKREVVMSLFQR